MSESDTYGEAKMGYNSDLNGHERDKKSSIMQGTRRRQHGNKRVQKCDMFRGIRDKGGEIC